MSKLRLLVTTECNRSCPGCCNHDWDLANLPKLPEFTPLFDYSEILLTGGEPLLDIGRLIKIVNDIEARCSFDSMIYVYTAYIQRVPMIIDHVDGITLTLHEPSDVVNFLALNDPGWVEQYAYKSLRLNVFKGIDTSLLGDLRYWKVKDNMEWVENCPLPEGEVFMRL